MLMSGVVKLTSGDASWWNLSALDYHYWTQPLPTVLGWWADKSPEWLKHFSTASVLVVEIVGAVPDLVSAAPAIARLRAARPPAGAHRPDRQLRFLQSPDHRALSPADRRLRLARPSPNESASRAVARWPIWVPALVIALTMPLNAILIVNGFKPDLRLAAALESLYDAVAPFRIVNGYGLFRVMTKERPEIIIEGSDDGIEWKPTSSNGNRARSIACPLSSSRTSRASIGRCGSRPWAMCGRTPGSSGWRCGCWRIRPTSSALLGKNPFPDKPPRYLRANIYRYHFSSRAEHRANRRLVAARG